MTGTIPDLMLLALWGHGSPGSLPDPAPFRLSMSLPISRHFLTASFVLFYFSNLNFLSHVLALKKFCENLNISAANALCVCSP